MNTKLTLTLDKSVIEKGKAYAQKNGKSLSKIFENYLKTLTKKEDSKEEDIEISPMVKSLMGRFKMPQDFDEKKELAKMREEKYQKYLDNDAK